MEFGITNSQIAYLLRCVAASYTLRNIDRFRIIAYERAADVIDHLGTQLHDLWKAGEFKNIEGIGKILTERIDDYFNNGKQSFLIKECEKIPFVVYQLMQVPGIGAKTANKLVTEFNLEHSKDILDDIKTVAKANKIAPLPGFGEKSQREFIASVETFQSKPYETARLRLDQAEVIYNQIILYLQTNSAIITIYPVGSLRRFSPTVGDIDIVAVCEDKDSKDIIDFFIKYPSTSIIEGKGEHKGAIILSSGVHVQLRTIAPEKLGAMLQYNTGSKEHNIRLREYALKKGYSLSEYGITTLENRKIHKEKQMIYFPSEVKFYNFLGLDYIPPELRQGREEIMQAKIHTVPTLVEASDILGDLQMHSNYPIEPSHDSGENSYEDLLDRAEQLGYAYIAFTDHNPSVGNHTDQEIISILSKRQQYISNLLSKKSKRTKYFISLEVDIRPDGQLSIPAKALDHVDFILIALHSSFTQTSVEMTNRIIKAMQNPKVKIFAHPTTRLIGGRDQVSADWKVIFKEAAKKNIALEIDAAPERLDLPDNLIVQANAVGCHFSLGTDAHKLSQMDNMHYGVSQARRGGLEKSAIINSMDYHSIKRYLLS